MTEIVVLEDGVPISVAMADEGIAASSPLRARWLLGAMVVAVLLGAGVLLVRSLFAADLPFPEAIVVNSVNSTVIVREADGSTWTVVLEGRPANFDTSQSAEQALARRPRPQWSWSGFGIWRRTPVPAHRGWAGFW
jgi:hypothetical protein